MHKLTENLIKTSSGDASSNLFIPMVPLANLQTLLGDSYIENKPEDSKETEQQIRYASFRDIILSGTDIAKSSIRRIVEIIIIERLSFVILKHLASFVKLKEKTIPEQLLIKSLTPAAGKVPNGSLPPAIKTLMLLLKRNYRENEIIPEAGFALELAQTLPSFSSDEPTLVNPVESLVGAYKHVGANDMSVRCLKSRGFRSEADNYSIMYAILLNIIDSLRFHTPGYVNKELIKSTSKDFSKRIDRSYLNEIAIKDFTNSLSAWKDIGFSSFPEGNAVAYTGARLRYFTSDLINDKTQTKGGKFVWDDGIFSLTEDYENTRVARMLRNSASHTNGLRDMSNSVSPAITDTNYFKSLEIAGELVAASIFDHNIYINKPFFTSNTLGDRVGAAPLSAYRRLLLGDNPEQISLGASIEDDVTLGQSSTNPTRSNVEHRLGIFGDHMLRVRTIPGTDSNGNSAIRTLPGSDDNFNIKGVIPGTSAIIASAFSEGNTDNLSAHIERLGFIASRFAFDIGKLTGVFNESDNTIADDNFKSANPLCKNPVVLVDEIMSAFGSQLPVSGFTNSQSLFGITSLMAKPEEVLTGARAKNVMTKLLLMSLATQSDKLMVSSFFSYYTNRSRYLAKSAMNDEVINGQSSNINDMLKAFGNDATNRALTQFLSLLGKLSTSYNDYQEADLDNDSFNHTTDLYFGQTKRYWARTADESASDLGTSGFISNEKFDGSSGLYGNHQESNHFSSQKTIVSIDNSHTTSDGITKVFDRVFRDKIESDAINLAPAVEGVLDENLKEAARERWDTLHDVTNLAAPAGNFRADYSGVETLIELFVVHTHAEKLGKYAQTDNETTDIQRSFAIYSLLCHIVAECLTLKVTFNSSPKNLEIQFNAIQYKAFKDALTGSTLTSKSRNENPEAARVYDIYKTVTKNVITRAKAPIIDRVNSLKIGLATITGHMNSLASIKDEIKSVIDKNKLTKPEKLAITHYGLADSQESQNPIFSNALIKTQLMSYLSSRSMAVMYQNYIDVIADSKNSKMFAPGKNYTDRQLYQMSLALSKQNYGMSSSEKFGKKTILNIGLPPRAVEQFVLDAYSRLEHDKHYTNSSYICIHVFKSDALGGNIRYYPKPFIFNSRLAAFDNFNFASIPDSDQSINTESINSFDSLLENFSLYKYQYTSALKKCDSLTSLLNESSDLEYMNESSKFTRKVALKEMKINHMLDFYLKMYMKLATGIDMGEYVFPLEMDKKLTNKVDSNINNLYETYEKDLFLRYPSINVDPILAREFMRLKKNIKGSKFFSLDEKLKNIFSQKCFERVYSLFVNEADFVVYPYPEIIKNMISQDSQTAALSSNQPFIESLKGLYDPCPYFNLDSRRQIWGINAESKFTLAGNLNMFGGAAQNFSGGSQMNDILDVATGKTRQFFKHMNEVESNNMSDVYEFFAVISVIRSK